MEEIKLTPKEYFEYIKGKKNLVTNEDLKKIYDNSLKLLEKYIITGQIKAALKLKFHLETIEKEKQIVDLGINTFVYKDDIEEYIDNVEGDVVKIIELENYEREVPDEIVAKISSVKNLFSNFYVVFTDYSGKIEKKIAKERREKDPILFGTFEDKKSSTIVERFYFIGDWIDEYCDLTLERMVAEMNIVGKNIAHNISTPKTFEELKEQLAKLEKTEDSNLFRITYN